jgi:hypothetical protein
MQCGAQLHRGRPCMRPSTHCGAGAHGSACGDRVRRYRRNGAQSRCRCGSGWPSPGADVAGVRPVPVQMWQGCAPVPGQMWEGASPVLMQMWQRMGPVPVQMWHGWAQSRCRCGMGGPSADADMATGTGPVPVQMWQGWARSRCRQCELCAQSRCRRGSGGPGPGADSASYVPSPGADVAAVGPVPVQTVRAMSQSRCRCGSGGPSRPFGGADGALRQRSSQHDEWQAGGPDARGTEVAFPSAMRANKQANTPLPRETTRPCAG